MFIVKIRLFCSLSFWGPEVQYCTNNHTARHSATRRLHNLLHVELLGRAVALHLRADEGLRVGVQGVEVQQRLQIASAFDLQYVCCLP